MFNAAMFGGVAKGAMLKQELKASQAPVPEEQEFLIQWHGSPYDGLRAKLGASVPGQTIVVLADGRKVSVPPTSLVAAPKAKEKEETDKTKKVVPEDKPDTRGDASQEEDLTKRAKENSIEKQQPPVLEHMKKGPKNVPVETARTAAEAGAALETLVAAAEAAQVATNAAADEAKAIQTKVGNAKSAEAKAVQTVIDEMERTGTVVAKIKDRLVALDSSKNKAAVNIPKTGALRVKYDAALAALTAIQAQVAEKQEAIKSLETEAEEQYGGTYNVKKRVSLFPASLQAALQTAAGFLDVVKGIADWVKGLFGLAEDAEKAVDELGAELEAAPVEASLVAGNDQIEEFVQAHATDAIEILRKDQQDAVAKGEHWDEGDASEVLFDLLSEWWAGSVGMPEEDGDFGAFDEALSRILALAKEQGVLFETMKFPQLDASLSATTRDAQKFIGDEIKHLVKDKGYEQKRAEGAAYSIARRKGYKASIVYAAWEARVQENYSSLEELEAYDEVYGIARRLGFDSATELWEANPLIGGSVNPQDLHVVEEEDADEKGFGDFAASLARRTGLRAKDAGVADKAAFKASVAPKGTDAWIADFIKAHGLRDLAPAPRAKK